MNRLSVLTGVLLLGCPTGAVFEGGVFRSELVRYRVGTLPPSWRRVSVPDGQVAFVEAATAATISANAACGGDDAPLRVLTRHLLFGLTERRELSRKTVPFDGREAMRTVVLGKLDGIPVQLDVVVLKKDGCVFDLVYTAHPDRFAERHADFERFAAGFRKLRLDGERP